MHRMSVKKLPDRSVAGYERSGVNDRFGYRPTPGRRQPVDLYRRRQGQNDRQRLLDDIHWRRLRKQWLEENRKKGREQWVNLGNDSLPIEQYRSEVMKMVATNRISLLAGETGSGKSTQLAQYALEMGYDHIVYLQPRRVTTDGIAERIDEELTEQFDRRGIEKPDGLVGMAHSERTTMRDDSVIQVMTSAVFASRASTLREEWEDKKILIVADEVHEGNIETEFAVATAAEILTEQDGWSMVLMSATMNEDAIHRAYTPINGKPIPKVEVHGRPHDIEYNEVPDKDVVEVFGDHCRDGNKTLIFTEGMRAIEAIEGELRKRFPGLRILKLHSKISDQERHEIFKKEVPGVHTVIISTSAGQSGITIPGIDRVISDGMTKSPELDAENAGGLPSRLCSQAEIIQQMGRGGRDIDGAKFFLANQVPYKKGQYGPSRAPFIALQERTLHAQADIYHTIITRNVLRAAAMGRDFYRLNDYLINDVSYSTIQEAYQVLRMMGAVNDDNECTPNGELMNKLPLRPELSRAVAEAVQSGTRQQVRQVAAIATAIEADGLGSGNPGRTTHNHEKLPAWVQDNFIEELVYFDYALKQAAITEDAPQTDNPREGVVKYHLVGSNIRRAQKQYAKICQKLGVETADEDSSLLDNLTPEGIAELKDMLIKGMPHLLYEKVGQRKHRGRMKKMPDGSKVRRPPINYYRNVLIGPAKDEAYEYDREISNRSILGRVATRATDLIAGYPRWYVDDNDVLHNVIERGFVIDIDRVRLALGSTAMSVKNHTVVGPDGRLRAVSESYVGSLRMDTTDRVDIADTRSKAELLVEAALRSPGSAQRDLREIKKTVDSFAGRIPKNKQQYYLERAMMSQKGFEGLLKRASKGAASTGQLDAQLRNIMATEDIRLESYISQARMDEINTTMPTTLQVGDSMYDVQYLDDDLATPYITNFPFESADMLPDSLTIPDGRTVMLRYSYGEGEDRYLTAVEVREASRGTAGCHEDA